jgi:hypothetical protein
MSCLYTESELIEKIKAAEIALSDIETESELDTSQSRHRSKRSPGQAIKSLEIWKDYLYRCYPETYRANYGSNIMRVTGPNR